MQGNLNLEGSSKVVDLLGHVWRFAHPTSSPVFSSKGILKIGNVSFAEKIEFVLTWTGSAWENMSVLLLDRRKKLSNLILVVSA